jgi:hypothetical protein
MDFEREEAPAPGFVLRTWPAWEDVLYLALRIGLRDDEVEEQRGHTFGRRNGREFDVTPDGTVSNRGVRFLWDAKYKADWDRGHRRVSATDVYEANAFLEAARVKQIALLYPRLASAGEPVACGETEVFEKIELDAGTIYGVAVEARGVSARRGLQTFSLNLAAGLDETFPATRKAAA